MYLLKATGSENSGVPNEDDRKHSGTSHMSKFTNVWAKDFHVSPFNSRLGSYSLAAVDPFYQDPPRVDNNIVLRSSEKHPKLVARIFSEDSPKDPSLLTASQVLAFIGSWWWVGFLTFPRILKEAYKLYFKRSLQVFFRPEVVPTSIGRRSTKIERDLESFFRRYLAHVVSQADGTIKISYTPAPGLGGPQELLPLNTSNAKATDLLEIKVTSPAFYSRFVHYNHTAEALDRECLFTDERNRTVWISNPQVLKMLSLQHREAIELPSGFDYFADSVGWQLLRFFRCPPAAPSYPDAEKADSPAFVREDIRPKNFSAFDKYVMQHCADGWLYRRCVIRLFLAERTVFGFTEVIDFLDVVVRICLILGTSWVVPNDLMNLYRFGEAGALTGGFTILKALAFNTIHVWSSIKGAF
ncbi:hypothetical protein MPH_10703 [Macrophomina phaseolina MS6]|uniref:Uncharacterized protein n=1 Tax=Macrophomina phaseolina (strain MS6) TaxID=1126212 RepID=K2S671_MACPH|nr:hypothetical protein MPH_10703 [Macrophomina phaseolina MS6]